MIWFLIYFTKTERDIGEQTHTMSLPPFALAHTAIRILHIKTRVCVSIQEDVISLENVLCLSEEPGLGPLNWQINVGWCGCTHGNGR